MNEAKQDSSSIEFYRTTNAIIHETGQARTNNQNFNELEPKLELNDFHSRHVNIRADLCFRL